MPGPTSPSQRSALGPSLSPLKGGEGPLSDRARSIRRSTSICAAMLIAARLMAALAAASPAGTRPRWRSGSFISGSDGRKPRQVISGKCRVIAASSTVRWRSRDTRLKITPASGTRGSWRAKPLIRAAAEAAWWRASTTRMTGHPVTVANSAVEPTSPSGPVPSNRPITPSHSTISASASSAATRAARVAGRIAQGSRLRQSRPLAAA